MTGPVGPGWPGIPSEILERFTIENLCGQGASGKVYRATQKSLARRVALKVLDLDPAEVDSQLENFIAEARVTACLRHPAIVQIFEHGLDGGVPWIAYEYLDGGTVASGLMKGVATVPAVIELAIQIAGALQEAHKNGILHRDVKLENIFTIPPNFYKLGDFGIARWSEGSAARTEAGVIRGTPSHLAPELLEGKAPSPGSDIYALGVSLFQALTGRLPHPSGNLWAMLEMIRTQPAPSVGTLVAEIPVDLDSIIARALDRDPTRRYQEVGQLLSDFERLRRSLATGTGARQLAGVPDRSEPTAILERRDVNVPPRGKSMIIRVAAVLTLSGILWSVFPNLGANKSAGESALEVSCRELLKRCADLQACPRDPPPAELTAGVARAFHQSVGALIAAGPSLATGDLGTLAIVARGLAEALETRSVLPVDRESLSQELRTTKSPSWFVHYLVNWPPPARGAHGDLVLDESAMWFDRSLAPGSTHFDENLLALVLDFKLTRYLGGEWTAADFENQLKSYLRRIRDLGPAMVARPVVRDHLLLLLVLVAQERMELLVIQLQEKKIGFSKAHPQKADDSLSRGIDAVSKLIESKDGSHLRDAIVGGDFRKSLRGDRSLDPLRTVLLEEAGDFPVIMKALVDAHGSLAVRALYTQIGCQILTNLDLFQLQTASALLRSAVIGERTADPGDWGFNLLTAVAGIKSDGAGAEARIRQSIQLLDSQYPGVGWCGKIEAWLVIQLYLFKYQRPGADRWTIARSIESEWRARSGDAKPPDDLLLRHRIRLRSSLERALSEALQDSAPGRIVR